MGIEVIFLALDGVLFDTEQLHLAACNAAFAEAGLPVRWTLPQLRAAVRLHGHAKAAAAALPQQLAIHEVVTELIAVKNRHLQEKAATHAPGIYPACLRLIEDALHAGCKLAALGDMPASLGAAMLERHFGHEVNSLFSVVMGDADFSTPAGTGPFARALHAMAAEPRTSIAIDSATPALRAAQASGIWTVSVTPYERDAACAAGADVWCPQLQELRHMIPAPPGVMESEPESHAQRRFLTFNSLRALKAGTVAPGKR